MYLTLWFCEYSIDSKNLDFYLINSLVIFLGVLFPQEADTVQAILISELIYYAASITISHYAATFFELHCITTTTGTTTTLSSSCCIVYMKTIMNTISLLGA